MTANPSHRSAHRNLFRRTALPVAAAFALVVSVAALAGSAWAQAPETPPGKPSSVQENVDNQLLVKFKKEHLKGVRNALGGVASQAAANVQDKLSQLGVKLQDHMNALGISVLRRTDKGQAQAKIIAALMRSGLVEYAEPDGKVSIQAVPNDAQYTTLWGMNNTGQNFGTPDADIDAQEAWDVTTGNPDNIVMVLDTGVNYLHEDLVDNAWTNPGEIAGNGIDDDANGYVDDVHGIDTIDGLGDPDADNDPMDDHGHGSHVSGTLGARGNNGIGVTGVNHQIKIMGCKFLNSVGEGEISDAVKCLDYAKTMKADHGFPILLTNNSWGCTSDDIGCDSQALKDAIQQTGEENMLFVASAGNEGANNDALPHFPSGYDLDNIISVAATDREDDLPFFSNFGLSTVDLGAPGWEINSTLLGNSYSGAVPLWSGTSMAAPHVSGAAALIWAKDPWRSYLEVKNLIMLTTDPLFSLADITVTGGRLNINSALTCVQGTPDMRILSPLEGFTAGLGQVLTVTARIQDCGIALQGATVTATPNNGDPQFTLFDDGIAPDKRAGDGLYTAAWLPFTPGNVTLAIAATQGANNFNGSVSGAVSNDNYVFDDQVAYNWIPAEGSNGNPTSINSPDDDFTSDVIPIGFDFTFYGTTYSELTVATDGIMGFGSVSVSGVNHPMPKGTGPAEIAPFWDDLVGSFWSFDTDGVWYRQEGTAPNRRLIVQWNRVSQWPGLGDATFQAILFETSNEIKFQYQDVIFEPTFGSDSDNGGSATIGVQNQDGTQAAQYSFNTASVSAGKAILFSAAVAGHQLKIAGGPEASPNPVFSGGQAQVGVSAVDNEGHPLSYHWTTDCAPGPNNDGKFNNPNIRAPIWTAPVHESGTPLSCTLSVTVDDGTDSVSGQFEMMVESAPPHLIDISSGPAGSPNPANPGDTVGLILSASDTLGHGLSFNWTASCPTLSGNGTFDDATAQNPEWTPPANNGTAPAACTLEVTVADGGTLSETVNYSQTVNPAHTLTILIEPDGTPNPVASGGQVALSVSAHDTHNHDLGYFWSTGCGGSFDSPSTQNPTWTAPVYDGEGDLSCVIGVTVNDGVINVTGQFEQFVRPSGGSPGDAILAVSPVSGDPEDFLASGPKGGPFDPASKKYIVSNTGGLAMDFTVSKAASWLQVSPASGTLGPGTSQEVVVSLTNRATKLKDGTYEDSIVFTNVTSGTGNTSRAATLIVGGAPPPPSGTVEVTPAEGLSASGKPGGVISAAISYLVTNTGTTTVNYLVTNGEPWVTALILEGDGALNPGETESVLVAINSYSTVLPAGSHSDTVTFTNDDDATVIAARPVTLNLRGKAR